MKDLSLGELGEAVTDGDLNPSITVAELIAGKVGSAGRTGVSFRSMKTGQDAVDTRTKAQREAFDRIVLGLFPPEYQVSSVEISRFLAPSVSTPDQMRKSLARSIEAGLIRKKGKARGTRYSLTAKGTKAAS